MELNQIYQGDSKELMKELNDNCIDLIVTSPPYWELKVYSDDEKDIGKEQPLQDYLNQMQEIYNGCFRVLKNNCHCCIVIRDITKSRICYPLHCMTIGLMNKAGFTLEEIKYVLLLSHAHYDFALIFRKGNSRFAGIMQDKYDEPFWDLRKMRGKKTTHPASFPVAIPSILIEKLSKKGEVVLDPFMGIGSTAIACIEKGRDYIGFELNQKFIEIWYQRKKKIQKGLNHYVQK